MILFCVICFIRVVQITKLFGTTHIHTHTCVCGGREEEEEKNNKDRKKHIE